jgi:hypothetical protein
MAIYVFRIAKGNDSGSPTGHCPLDYGETIKERDSLTSNDIKEINYEDKNYKKLYLNFLHNELWNNNTLRQGWGIKGLDLSQDVPSWIKNYILNGKIFWNTDIECETAKGRWNIISRMYNSKTKKGMNENDYIIIPKTSNNIEIVNDYYHFVVCQIDKPYYFDYSEKIKDFGHCVKVKNIKIFKYSENTLLRKDFSAPYLWAITEVKDSHSRYIKFKDFIDSIYK